MAERTQLGNIASLKLIDEWTQQSIQLKLLNDSLTNICVAHCDKNLNAKLLVGLVFTCTMAQLLLDICTTVTTSNLSKAHERRESTAVK